MAVGHITMPITRRITRRTALHTLAAGAGVSALSGLVRAAQDTPDALVARMRADLERHAGFGSKFSAGPGDLATADWIADRLRRAGYTVARSTFEAPFFVKRTTRVTIGGTSVEVMPQAPVATTGRDGVTGRLALVEGEGGDLRGRLAVIVLASGRHAALFPERGIGRTVTAAANAGAQAIIIVTTGPTGEAIALNAPEHQPFVKVPVAILAPRLAAPVVDAARTGATATLTVDGEATHRPSPNLVARVVRGDRWIVISTPRSGWFDCVGERGTGTTVFLELADWAVRRFPNHSLFLMNTGGHEYFFAGSHKVLHEAPPPDRTAVWAHVGATLAARDAEERDGTLRMLDTADPQRSLMTSDAARAAAARAFAGLSGLTEPVPVRPSAGELSTFTDRGYSAAFAVLGLHRWLHTVQDTIERVDARLLVPVLRAHQGTIETLAG